MKLNQLSSQIIKAAGNYLRLSKKPLGLFINFNEAMLKDGITRIIKHHLWGLCELKRFRSIGRAGERIFAQRSDVKELLW